MRRRRNSVSFDRVNGKTVVFTGGVNEGITNLELRPGDLFRCLNYEEVDGAYHGYSSVQGFERYDGQPSPSDVFVELLEDSGNDERTVLLLESEDSADNSDKSDSGFPINQSEVSFDITRSFWGEGSYKFSKDMDSYIQVDQGLESLPFTNDEFTIDGMFQCQSNTDYGVIFEKSGVMRLSVSGAVVTLDWSTNAGVSYNRSISAVNLVIPNRWNQFGIVYLNEEMLLGVNGTLEASLDITGQTIHNNSNDFFVGDGDTSTMDMWVDSLRMSTVARWSSDYNRSTDYAYSDGRYYIFNADDRDRELARDLILPVPGEGDIRDVHIYQGDAYAVRDKVGGASGGLYKESVAGWVELSPLRTVFRFDNSSIPEDTENTLFGEAWTSSGGATGTIWDYVYETGTPEAGKSQGYCIVIVSTGTLGIGETITITTTTGTMDVLTAPLTSEVGAGPDVDFVTGRFAYFPPNAPNSELAFMVANDLGYLATDGTSLIHMLQPEDITINPKKIQIFGDRLWIAYEGGHLFYSAVGDPTNFSGEFGGGEIFLGDDITNLIIAPGGSLVIIMRNSIKIIKQNNPNAATVGYPFIVNDFTDRSGGYQNTGVNLLGDVFFCDDRGPAAMKAVDAFGDFQLGDMKKKTHITYQENKSSITGAYVQRQKSQYRIHFNDPDNSSTKAIFITFSGDQRQVKGSTLVEYPVEFKCFDEGEDLNGDLKIVAGGSEGYIYHLDKGVSFDGGEIRTSMTSAFYHYGTPRLWKRFHRILFEISAPNKTQFYVQPDYNYSSSRMLSTKEDEFRTVGQGGIWGQSQWGSFIWGGSVVSNPMVYTRGAGYNMAVKLRTVNKHSLPHTVHNMIVDYANGSRVM